MSRQPGIYVCLLLFLLEMSSAQATAVPIRIFVSILPQKYLVERIGGDRVQVDVMVRPGTNAETYEPLPRQMAALSDADLYFRIGVPFESIWIKKIIAVHPDLGIVACCAELVPEKIRNVVHDNNDVDVHAYDAHIWTSPRNAIYIANMMMQTLAEVDPAHRDYYERNHAGLVQDLNDLDHYIRHQFEALGNRYLVVAHPSWSCFADAYGLTQVALERHDAELRPRQLAELVNFARNNGIHTIYVEKQFNAAAARLLAREIKAEIVELDPLAGDYITNLQKVTQAIVAGSK